MIKPSKLFCSLIVFYSCFSMADEQLFHLRLLGYPKTHQKCEVTAQEVATAFEKQASVTVLSSKCLEIDKGFCSENTIAKYCNLNVFNYYNIEIKYTAPKEFELVPSASWPIHVSYESCSQNLSSEKNTFESDTGLKTVLSYCSLISSRIDRKGEIISRYSTAFYGIGAAKAYQKSHALKTSVYSSSLGSLGQEIFEKSQASGIPVRNMAVDEVHSSIWLKFAFPKEKKEIHWWNYYLWKDSIHNRGDEPYTPTGNPLLMRSASQCLEQLESVKKLFASYYSNPVTWVCEWDVTGYSGYTPSTYKFNYIYYIRHLRIKPGPESFYRFIPGTNGEPFLNEYLSKENCEKDKPRILSYYKEKLGNNLIGALCSFPIELNPAIPAKMFVYALQ